MPLTELEKNGMGNLWLTFGVVLGLEEKQAHGIKIFWTIKTRLEIKRITKIISTTHSSKTDLSSYKIIAFSLSPLKKKLKNQDLLIGLVLLHTSQTD